MGYVGYLLPRYAAGSLERAFAGAKKSGSAAWKRVFDPLVMHTLVTDIVSALAELHRRNMPHSSLRPSNVLITTAGNGRISSAVLADYGMESTKANMGNMTMIPSVAYLSPDVLRGLPESPESDMFVLGKLIYEMVTQTPAFIGGNALEGVHPPKIRAIIEQCWKEPRERPTTEILEGDLK